MGTTSLLVLCLVLVCALVSSAPVENPMEEIVEIAKRDQEIILYGNQQNDPRVKKKKSDSSVPLIDAVNSIDQGGFVKAVPAVQEAVFPTAHVEEDSVNQAAQSAEVSQEQSAEDEIPPITQQIPEEPAVTDSQENAEVPEPEVGDAVEEELEEVLAENNAPLEDVYAENNEPEVIPDEEEPTVSAVEEEPEEVDVPQDTEESHETDVKPAQAADDETLMNLYYYMLQNEQKNKNEYPAGNYYPYGMDYYNYRRRRSARPVRAATEGGMTRNEPVVKRSKRIKRDLLDGEEDSYYYPYGEVETYSPELTEEELYELYRPEPKYEDDVEALLDMYQQPVEEPMYVPYQPYPIEDSYQEVYEEEQPQYVPTKRQMMSSLPGIRKRYFYPFNREPATHWGAFVPEQKRDYDRTYSRLLALASALSEESPYYQVYQKK